MQTATTKAVRRKQSQYMRLESASTFQLLKSLWKKLDVYFLALAVGIILGLAI